jgi:hypothetical protein
MVDSAKSVQKHAKERFGFAKKQKSDLLLTPFFNDVFGQQLETLNRGR